MYLVPDIVLVGYGRQQMFQIKCLKCQKIFFESITTTKDNRELFCEDCRFKYSDEKLNQYIKDSNKTDQYYIGNIVDWIVKSDTSTKRSRYNYAKVYKRDGYVCQYCGYSPKKHEIFLPLHIDHIYPFVKGGTNKMENLVVACQQCNLLVKSKVFSSFEDKQIYILKEKLKRNLFYDKNFTKYVNFKSEVVKC